jgi:hypothetical protein
MSRLTCHLSPVTYVLDSDTPAGATFPSWNALFGRLRTTPDDPYPGSVTDPATGWIAPVNATSQVRRVPLLGSGYMGVAAHRLPAAGSVPQEFLTTLGWAPHPPAGRPRRGTGRGVAWSAAPTVDEVHNAARAPWGSSRRPARRGGGCPVRVRVPALVGVGVPGLVWSPDGSRLLLRTDTLATWVPQDAGGPKPIPGISSESIWQDSAWHPTWSS